jgi:hypothetical protein
MKLNLNFTLYFLSWYIGEVKRNEARYAVARTKRSSWYARGCSSPMAYQYAGETLRLPNILCLVFTSGFVNLFLTILIFFNG